jgi:hypothetical protein
MPMFYGDYRATAEINGKEICADFNFPKRGGHQLKITLKAD